MTKASDRGTLIKIFNTLYGEKVNEVRWGAYTVVISNILIDLLINCMMKKMKIIWVQFQEYRANLTSKGVLLI